jgi:amidase
MSKEGLLSGEYAWQRYPTVYAKSVNLARQLKDTYDATLEKYDVLIMPTTITPANKLPPVKSSPLVHIDAAKGKLENTSAFNASGHPALAMPIGFVEKIDEETRGKVRLPVSCQIVGKWWDEAKVLKVGYAWEGARDWKEL